MPEIILYYSFGGQTRRWAEQRAKATGAALAAVEPAVEYGRILAYTKGCAQALAGKTIDIKPLDVDLAAYDTITLAGPVWASHPAPAMNSAAELLPAGRAVRVVLLSLSGRGDAAALIERIEKRGCTVAGVEHYKPGEEKAQ